MLMMGRPLAVRSAFSTPHPIGFDFQDDDRSAFVGEALDNAASQSIAAAGNQGRLSRQAFHGGSFVQIHTNYTRARHR